MLTTLNTAYSDTRASDLAWALGREPLPALAAETDSYHGADESLMESLIAKPDTLA